MTILWVLKHAGFARNYDGVLRTLAAAGHRIHILYESGRNKLGENVLVDRLIDEWPTITAARAPERTDTLWSTTATAVRTIQDYARYHEPEYRNAPLLRERAEKFLPLPLLWLVKVAAATAAGRALLRSLLRTTERALPPSEEALAELQTHRPDLVIVTPLVDFGSQQVDYLKAAARLGIPAAVGVASWDNLTNKGLLRWAPDQVFVWNDAQRVEAIQLHRIPADRVTVTGAQIFDHWFSWDVSRSRASFCVEVGLNPDRPFVLYLGSSPFLAPREAEHVQQWIAAIRSSTDPMLRDAGILVRPHPNSTRQWAGVDLARFGNASIWPGPGADPFVAQFKHDFYDSLYHSGLVVGVNTSAQIEAAIVGRAVLTLESDDFRHSQEGTLHFHHLAGDANGGLLYVARSMDEHLEQMRAILAGEYDMTRRTERFVEAFVRPQGRHLPSGPILTDAILRLGAMERIRDREPMTAPLIRALIYLPAQWNRLVWDMRRRPWWAVLVRLGVSLYVTAAAIWYGVTFGGPRLAAKWSERASLSSRRLRRAVWTVWYESSQVARKYRARAVKGAKHLRGRVPEGVRRRGRRFARSLGVSSAAGKGGRP